MTHDASDGPTLAHALLAAVQPLLAQLRRRRSLSPGKYGILQHLDVVGQATTSELAAQIQVSPQGISLAAHELGELGLIARVPDTVDRRRTWITITDAGRERFALERTAGHEWLSQAIAARLTPEEVALVDAAIPALRKIVPEAVHE